MSWSYLKYDKVKLDTQILANFGLTGSDLLGALGGDVSAANGYRRDEIDTIETTKFISFLKATPSNIVIFPDKAESFTTNEWSYIKYDKTVLDTQILANFGLTGSDLLGALGGDVAAANGYRRDEIDSTETTKFISFLKATPSNIVMFPVADTSPASTGIITVKTSYKDLGAGLGNGLEISLECDTERDITGFDLRFDETGQSSSWKYLKLENVTNNSNIIPNTGASGTVFDPNSDWYITNNSGNHPNDGLTRINGFTGESTNNSGTWTFNNKITITANVPLTLMKLLPGTNTDQNNLPQLVYADLVKTVGGELYNDDKDDNNASIVVIDTTAVVTPLAQSVIIQN